METFFLSVLLLISLKLLNETLNEIHLNPDFNSDRCLIGFFGAFIMFQIAALELFFHFNFIP